MTAQLDGLDRYLLITSDTHAGPDPEGYRPYIEKKWLGEFDAWIAQTDALLPLAGNQERLDVTDFGSKRSIQRELPLASSMDSS